MSILILTDGSLRYIHFYDSVWMEPIKLSIMSNQPIYTFRNYSFKGDLLNCFSSTSLQVAKKFSLFLIIIPALFAMRCAPVVYYQVYKTAHADGVDNGNNIIFSDENCEVKYDLWRDHGDMGFIFVNKSDKYLTLDLNRSFFVLNGEVFDYYKDRTYSSSTGVSVGAAISGPYRPYYWSTGIATVSGSGSAGASSSIREKGERVIPPHTSIQISEFGISAILYTDCNMPLGKSKQGIPTVSFTEENSPFNFYNILRYREGETDYEMSHSFYVTSIANKPESQMFDRVTKNECGEELYYSGRVFRERRANMFYILYKQQR